MRRSYRPEYPVPGTGYSWSGTEYDRCVDADELLRAACFLALDALRAKLGSELPYQGALDQGFEFDGRRVPFMNPYKGIHRAGAQRGPAALSVVTSWRNPYEDGEAEDGLDYAYRVGDIDQPDNRALRAAVFEHAPLAYFVGTRSGRFQTLYPCYAVGDDPSERRVYLSPGATTVDGTSVPIVDAIERRYVMREVRDRLHQGRFRGLVLSAYRDRCTICRLRESRLLDASHIVPDAELEGVPEIRNGLALCTIHHRAYDHDLVGISPDYRVHVAPRLLDEDDGPMLDLLKAAQGVSIALPTANRSRPGRELLAVRFARFGRA
jgi:putative restriction endonuclease